MRLNYQRIHDITRTLNDYCSADDETRLEPADFTLMYNLSEQEAKVIVMIAKGNGYCNLPDGQDKEACVKVVEMMSEALHQDLDGWDTDEQALIQHFILDVMYAVSLS